LLLQNYSSTQYDLTKYKFIITIAILNEISVINWDGKTGAKGN